MKPIRYTSAIVGTLMLVWAPAAFAATCQDQSRTSQILSMKAVSSHYVQKVIDRAFDGLAYANESRPSAMAELFFSGWVTSILTVSTQVVDTDLRIAEEQLGLREQTACLHIDSLMIEAMMDRVRCEVNTALTDDSMNIGKLVRLKSLQLFLNESFRNLMAGANNPQFEDSTWARNRAFDRPGTVWCLLPAGNRVECGETTSEKCWAQSAGSTYMTKHACEESLFGQNTTNEPDAADQMCPFTSNYLPPTSSGFGCDTEILEEYQSLDPVAAEYDALEKLITERDTFIKNGESTKDMKLKIDEFMGQTDPEEVAALERFGEGHSENREHKEVSGCAEAVVNQLENEGVTVDTTTLNTLLFQMGATSMEPRGPFSLSQDESTLMNELLSLYATWSAQRPFADFLKSPQEYTDAGDRRQAQSRDNLLSPLGRVIRTAARVATQQWQIEQSRHESTVAVKVTDAQLNLLKEYQEIRTSVRALSEQASNKDEGARNFTRNFAWFLRRTCLYRPCNQALETTLKIVLQDSCFPYVTGLFLTDEEIQETCRDDAEL